MHFSGCRRPSNFWLFSSSRAFSATKSSKEGLGFSSTACSLFSSTSRTTPPPTARLATPTSRRPTVRERCAGVFSPAITHAYALLHSPPLVMNRLPESNLLICFHRAQARHRPLQGVPRRLRRGYRHLHQVPLRVNLALGTGDTVARRPTASKPLGRRTLHIQIPYTKTGSPLVAGDCGSIPQDLLNESLCGLPCADTAQARERPRRRRNRHACRQKTQ